MHYSSALTMLNAIKKLSGGKIIIKTDKKHSLSTQFITLMLTFPKGK
jgi:hypothetical protein